MLRFDPKNFPFTHFGHKPFPQNKSSMTFKCLLMQNIRKKSNEASMRKWCNRQMAG